MTPAPARDRRPLGRRGTPACSTSPSSPSPTLGRPLAGRGAALIFEKPSTRTRHSMEMAVVQLGGHPVYTRGDEVGIDMREPVEDVARILAGVPRRDRRPGLRPRRCWSGWSAVATVPVVNLLSDRAHPLQAFADALTMEQALGALAGRTVAWVGDYNNVARSLGEIGALLGGNVRFACPVGFGPDDAELERLALLGRPSVSARSPARRRGGRVPTRCTPTRGCRWVRRTTRRRAGGRSRGSPSTAR